MVNSAHPLAETASSDADYERLGLARNDIKPWEDGARTDDRPGTYEWWYFDAHLMGGTKLARQVTLAALRNGKVVVSANKALICEHGAEIFDLAQKHGGHFFFEASVAGGIPIIKALREGLVANRFPRIYGILNGT